MSAHTWNAQFHDLLTVGFAEEHDPGDGEQFSIARKGYSVIRLTASGAETRTMDNPDNLPVGALLNVILESDSATVTLTGIEPDDVVLNAAGQCALLTVTADEDGEHQWRRVSSDAAVVTASPLIASAVAELAALAPMDGKAVLLLGYYAAGDGGGQILYYSAASAATVNGGFVFNGPGGVGRYLAADTTVANVKRFGAKGDNAADDTAEIQAALNSGAKLVLVPTGQYIVSADLALPSDVFVEGAEGGTSIIKTTHAVAIAIKTPYTTLLGVDRSYGGGLRNLTFLRSTGTQAGSIGLRMYQHTHGLFDNVIFDGFETAIDVAGWSFYNRYRAIQAQNCTGDAFKIRSGTRQALWEGCHTYTTGAAKAGWLISADSTDFVNDITFVGCRAEGGTGADQRGAIIQGAGGKTATGIRFIGFAVDFTGATTGGIEQKAGGDQIVVAGLWASGVTTVNRVIAADTTTVLSLDTVDTAGVLHADVLKFYSAGVVEGILRYNAAFPGVTFRNSADSAWIDLYFGTGVATGTFNATGGLVAGSGQTLYKFVSASVTKDVGSINAATSSRQTFAVPGAVVDKYVVSVSPPTNFDTGLIIAHAFVSAADVVTVEIYNPTAGAIDPASGVWRFACFQIVA